MTPNTSKTARAETLPATQGDTPPPAPRPAHPFELVEKPIYIWDEKNPRAIINLLPKATREAVMKALYNSPELFDVDEQHLFRTLREKELSPSATDNRLRLKFWFEYDYCQAYFSKEIDIARVAAGVCSYEYLTMKYLKEPYKVAWMLCPPVGYAAKVHEALEFGIEQLRDILEAPHKVGGKIDTKLGELKLKIVMNMELRERGSVPQKIISAHLSGKQAVDAVKNATTGPSMEDLDKRIKAAQERQKKLLNGGAVINVTKKVGEEK